MRQFKLFTFVRFETMIWPSTYQVWHELTELQKVKPLDIFSPQIERKRSKEYLVIILAVKESFELFSCLEFIFEKSKGNGKPAFKNINLRFKLKDLAFLETL